MRGKRLIPPLVVIAVWQIVTTVGGIPSYKLPSPLQVLVGLKDLVVVGLPPGHLLHTHALYSLERVFLGYSVAVLIGIPLGIAVGRSRRVRFLVGPFIELLRPIPPLAWIPIAILWFGIGLKSAAFIIFLGAFFPILLNTCAGVRAVDPLLIEAMRTLNGNTRDIVFKVLIPGSIPSIITGMRIGLGLGWMTLVAAEFSGVKQGYGLGYMIMTARDIQRPDQILAGMFFIGVTGFLIDGSLRLLEKSLVRWR